MRRTTLLLGFAGVALMASACENPAVDPNATYEAEGALKNAMNAPLAGAEVRLIKFSSGLNLFTPSAENLFANDPSNESDIDLSVSLVKSAITDANGNFHMAFTGQEIAAPGGYTTASGLVEVATTVIVVRDPSPMNSEKRAGVYTYDYVFQRAAKVWNTGTLHMWNAEARADTSRALSHGLVDFSWSRLPDLRMTNVKNAYRVDIGAPNGPSRLIIRCNEGLLIEGGCSADGMDSSRLTRAVSAFSLENYYSDASGMFSAYVHASDADFRYVARFTVTSPIPQIPRDPITIEEIWAVGMGADQNLENSQANDGNLATRESIRNHATAIYVRLTPENVSDAGLLNSIVENAENGCVVLEFTGRDFDIASAKASADAMWDQAGKFCGENGAKGEVSALASFDTALQDGILASWMRLRAVHDGAGLAPEFKAVGEIGVYKRSM